MNSANSRHRTGFMNASAPQAEAEVTAPGPTEMPVKVNEHRDPRGAQPNERECDHSTSRCLTDRA